MTVKDSATLSWSMTWEVANGIERDSKSGKRHDKEQDKRNSTGEVLKQD